MCHVHATSLPTFPSLTSHSSTTIRIFSTASPPNPLPPSFPPTPPHLCQEGGDEPVDPSELLACAEEEEESTSSLVSEAVRVKCFTQLLLLGALNQVQVGRGMR